MGLKEWMLEFYPTEAENCGEGAEAIEHSLKKWQGIAEVATFTGSKELGVIIKRDKLLDPITFETFDPNVYNCALCVHYYKEEGKATCSGCPIVKVTGKACDEHGVDDEGCEVDSEWYEWTCNNDPVPMVKLLERVKAEYENLTKE